MSHVAPFTRLSGFACLLCGLLACGAARGQELERHFTGVVTDVLGVPDTIVGDTVSGSMSFAAGALVTTSSDGATQDSATHETTSPLSHATITFSGGPDFETGTHPGTQYTSVDLSRGVSLPFPGTNIYALTSADETGPENAMGVMLQLSVTDFLGSTSQIFSTPAGDLSLLQPVDWLAPGATSLGQLSASGDMTAQFRLTSVDVVSASPAPEPATFFLLAAGLVVTAGKRLAMLRVGRRRAGNC
jgi:hypothetical protein